MPAKQIPLRKPSAQTCSAHKNISLVIHGGFGGKASPAQLEFVQGLLRKGHEQLISGIASMEVVRDAVLEMENSGLFNAGKGASRTRIKTVELDAAIMSGADLKAGAVASVPNLKNPILAADALLKKPLSLTVMLTGQGALDFAKENGLETMDSSYFQRVTADETTDKKHYGTVGAVAMDRCGDIAAATSTGGLSGKLPGRVGDSPLIGAGTYANNRTCAVSATGVGEYFIRANGAHTISDLMEFKGLSLKAAVKEGLKRVAALNGGNIPGGFIAVDAKGNMIMHPGHPLLAGSISTDGTIKMNSAD